MIEKLNAGQFPVLQRDINEDRFVKHWRKLPTFVELPDGDRAETGYIRVSERYDGVAKPEFFDLFGLCQNNGKSEKLTIQSLVYVDEGDNLCEHVIKHLAPVVLADPAYVSNGKASISIGYVTKVCGLRWGFVLKLDPRTGQCTIDTDLESPILGIKLKFS